MVDPASQPIPPPSWSLLLFLWLAGALALILTFGLLFVVGGDAVRGVEAGSFPASLAYSARVAVGLHGGRAITQYARSLVSLEGMLGPAWCCAGVTVGAVRVFQRGGPM